ncbi:N-acetyltransferase [Sphingomonas lacunae]|uniref:N-acetyltransferase n=1 Tax=Sphingomonas lacunae TaxID=2698828 RepID=A0A6M4B2A5_9SPHN|nr:N-acetyltransferase [Sphingomonas lacunae]QJQ33551.1 N-acetyltransferase [Sphingomonas lacunae]
MVEIKPLSTASQPAIEALLDAAFGPDRFGRTAYRLRAGTFALPDLSFAAFDQGRLVGTLQSWPVALEQADGMRSSLVMVGPVAVEPDVQRGGIGRAMMDALVAAADAGADAALMMIGDPEYYGRFWGFTADATGGWDLPGPFERRRLLARSAHRHDPPAINGHVVPDPARNPD